MELTERQREFVRHAIGLNGRSKMTYRNHFVIGKGGDGYEDWMDLVRKGYAHHRAGSEISGGDDVFWATRETALAVRKPREHVSPDFRE